MMKKALRKLTEVVLIIILISVFAGCGKGILKADSSISFNLGPEPETIDPALNTEIGGANIILACFEGLMRLDKNNKAIPGMAASYTREYDVKYTFKLRDAKWSDGKPVTANDFCYSWKRVLNPDTGSFNAYQMYCIKGGEAYNKRISGPEALGIRVIDDKTLEVTLEKPVSYFLEFLALPVYMPVRQDIVGSNPDKWWGFPSSYIGNGPFKLSGRKSVDTLELVKNNGYYDADRVKINRLTFRMIEDEERYLEAWEKGEIDIIQSPPASDAARLKSQGKLTVSPYLGVYFYSFNNKVKPLDDKRVRKALTYAVDRVYLIRDVIKNEYLSADAYVPKGIKEGYDSALDFRDTNAPYFKPEGDVMEAKKLLSDAGYPDGANFPELTLTYDNTGLHESIAKAIQHMWKENLGITIKLKALDWKTLQNSRRTGDYDIARFGWIADYADPMAFMSIFLGSANNNDAKYANAAYDNLIASAENESDPAARSRLLHDAEAMLAEDMPVLPLYFYTDSMCIKPGVKDVVKSPLGFIYFDQAYKQ